MCLDQLQDLHNRVAAPRSWASVADTADYALGRWAAQATGAEQRALQAWLAQLTVYAQR